MLNTIRDFIIVGLMLGFVFFIAQTCRAEEYLINDKGERVICEMKLIEATDMSVVFAEECVRVKDLERMVFGEIQNNERVIDRE